MNETAVPWYKLAVVQRLALGIVAHLIALSPLAKYLGGVDLAPLVNDALNGIGLLLDSWALHARVTKPCPPVAGVPVTPAPPEKTP